MLSRPTFRPSRWLLIVLCVLGISFGMVKTVQAVLENKKISGDIIPDGTVHFFTISPDGQHTVFVGDLHTDDRYELYSVHTTGGDRVTLSTGLIGTEGVVDFLISPDSQWVIYGVGPGAINPNQLFAVPIRGGTPIELYQGEPGNSYGSIARFSPDSTTVLFMENFPDTNQQVLRSVPVAGGTVRTIAAPEEWCFIDFQITSDSKYVVYNIEEAGCDDHGLFRSSLTGTGKVTLDATYAQQFQLSPQGDFVIYTKNAPAELYSLPIGGGTPTKLNGTLVGTGYVYPDFKITPDNQYVIYRSVEMVPNMILLYRASVDASDPRINLTPWGMTENGNVVSFKITPNSLGVVYRADFLVDEHYNLYAVLIAGSPYVELSPDMDPDGDVINYEITPNNLGVVFIADGRTDEVYELYGAVINGTLTKVLHEAHPEYADVEEFRIAPNSQFVVYRAPTEETGPLNLLVIPSWGGTPLQINPEPVFGGYVRNYYAITPDSKGVVYRADQETDDQVELFVTYDYLKLYLPLMVH